MPPKHSKKNSNQPKSPSQALSDDSIDERPLTANDLHLVKDELLKAIMDNQSKLTSKFDDLRLEFHEIRNEFKELKENQAFISDKYDSLKESSERQSKKIDELSEQNATLEASLGSLSKQFEILDKEQEDIRKYLRRDCLEITGIPFAQFESTDVLVKKVGNLVNVQISDNDISVSHRIPSRSRPVPSIIVKFARRSTRDALLKGKKLLRNKTSSDIGFQDHNKIFINESLTPKTRELFKQVNSYRKQYNLKSCWTYNGKVYLQESDETDKMVFESLLQFDEYKNYSGY